MRQEMRTSPQRLLLNRLFKAGYPEHYTDKNGTCLTERKRASVIRLVRVNYDMNLGGKLLEWTGQKI